MTPLHALALGGCIVLGVALLIVAGLVVVAHALIRKMPAPQDVLTDDELERVRGGA